MHLVFCLAASYCSSAFFWLSFPYIPPTLLPPFTCHSPRPHSHWSQLLISPLEPSGTFGDMWDYQTNLYSFMAPKWCHSCPMWWQLTVANWLFKPSFSFLPSSVPHVFFLLPVSLQLFRIVFSIPGLRNLFFPLDERKLIYMVMAGNNMMEIRITRYASYSSSHASLIASIWPANTLTSLPINRTLFLSGTVEVLSLDLCRHIFNEVLHSGAQKE